MMNEILNSPIVVFEFLEKQGFTNQARDAVLYGTTKSFNMTSFAIFLPTG